MMMIMKKRLMVGLKKERELDVLDAGSDGEIILVNDDEKKDFNY